MTSGKNPSERAASADENAKLLNPYSFFYSPIFQNRMSCSVENMTENVSRTQNDYMSPFDSQIDFHRATP
jgi:hypothetical protein